MLCGRCPCADAAPRRGCILRCARQVSPSLGPFFIRCPSCAPGIATEYEGCIPRETRQRHPCNGRWVWAECRVFNALWRLNLSFTEFPPTQLNWALLGLTGSSASPRIERRKGVATVWGGPRFPTHEVASSILEPSNFARTPCTHRPRTQNATSRYSVGAPDGLNY